MKNKKKEEIKLTFRQKLALEWIIFKINLKYWLGML